jgi:hypothetical protein
VTLYSLDGGREIARTLKGTDTETNRTSTVQLIFKMESNRQYRSREKSTYRQQVRFLLNTKADLVGGGGAGFG